MQELASSCEQNKVSLATEVLRSFGKLHLKAVGTSMLPALWPGDLLTVQAVQFESVFPGDLILYSRDNRFFVHRLIEKRTERGGKLLIAHGDALLCADLPFRSEALLGRVVEIFRAGRVRVPSRRWHRLQRLVGRMLGRSDQLCGLALRLKRKNCFSLGGLS